VVLAVPGRDGQNDLEAAVTGAAGDPDQMYKALSTRLPAYMVPRGITVVDELPLNAHGKTDRRALAARLGGSAVDSGAGRAGAGTGGAPTAATGAASSVTS